jgi:competence protein ComEA
MHNGMKKAKILSDYLTFTKKERIGLLALIALIAIVWALPMLIRSAAKPQNVPPDTSWMAAINRLQTVSEKTSDKDEDSDVSSHQYQPSGTDKYKLSASLFEFDPNTISDQEWARFGVRQKTIKTIRNYLQKGGRFYKAEDLSRIYGLRNEEYQRLAPFVRIALREKYLKESDSPMMSAPRTTFVPVRVDINNSDTSQWIALPGIGSKLAARIISFREKLGGFYSVDQIKETYGLADSVFKKIQPHLFVTVEKLKLININTATKDELKTHPYLKWALANAIVEYRNQHGPYRSLDELKKITLIPVADYNRIIAYLVLE